jgi:large subunit ribosomal protein L9
MEVILLEKVANLGEIGDMVKVKSGYGRNFLLPKGKATLATPANIAAFEARRDEFEARQAGELETAQGRAAQVAALSIRMEAKAGVEGKLFGSIGTIDIAEACTTAGVEIQRSEVRLPDGPLRMVGEHEVEIVLHTDVSTTLTVLVEGEEDSA